MCNKKSKSPMVLSSKFVYIVLIFLLFGCATSPSSNRSRKINQGMSKDEVLRIMGKPQRTHKDNYGDEAWEYFDHGWMTHTVIWLYQDNVIEVSQYERDPVGRIGFSNSPGYEEYERQRELAEAQARQAREEANRYDPSNFIIVPSNFQPVDYTKADLFDAVAASERWPYTITYGSRFVSDVVFVSQNGTDITFRTDDNAIRRSMKVDARTGLTMGQRVRIYYIAYKIEEWRVTAIERL